MSSQKFTSEFKADAVRCALDRERQTVMTASWLARRDLIEMLRHKLLQRVVSISGATTIGIKDPPYLV